MARHIMAVCVVCLLCADRLPCEQHNDDGGIYNNNNNANIEFKKLNAKVFQRFDAAAAATLTTRKYEQLNNNNNNNYKNNNHNKNEATNAAELKFYSTDNNHNNLLKQHHNTQSLDGNKNTNYQAQQQQQQQQPHRRKRHAGHSHGVENDGGSSAGSTRPAITQDFLQRIFDEYGHGDGSLSINEFRSMLKQLGLHQLIEKKFAKNLTVDSQQQQQPHNTAGSCLADASLIRHLQEQISHEHHDHDSSSHHAEHHQHDHHDKNVATTITNTSRNCLSNGTEAEALNDTALCNDLSTQNAYSTNYTIKDVDLINLCPVLLYQLASPSESKRAGCIDDNIITEIEERIRKNSQIGKEDIMYVWIYAFISVFACGILGLVGVAIIPFMDSRYYKHIIQYLVSLAVGTMTGDALLHLLPHSLAGHDESGMILKGLTCMGGIIFFYITEHGLTMISEWRKRKAKKETKQSRAKVMRDPDSSITNSTAGDKLCKSKYSSYPYCYDEIAMDTKNDVWMHLPNNTTAAANPNDKLTISGSAGGAATAERKRNGRAEANANEVMAAQSLLSTSHNNYAPMNEVTANHHQHNHEDHQQLQSNHSKLDQLEIGGGAGNGAAADGKVVAVGDDKAVDTTVTVILREHESSHHGHSHKHGHVHSPPESLSAVAWMIIMGDGLHNFTDGMAIGAAFADNIAGGFSTSLAVFCHELPHELGDFAILMKAGMSVKSAVYYNLLTGVLSFIGMIVGIVFGQSQDAAQWMFAAAAGLFIYIALVDMMPELSAAHKSLEQLALQIFGMSTGVFLMLLIAIYEGELMSAFSSSTGPASGH